MKQKIKFLARYFYLGALLTLISACNKQAAPTTPPPAPVSVIELKATDVLIIKDMVGETAGYRDVDVRSRVNGILLKRTYVEGEKVNAGQVLFEIDPESYKASLDQAKGQLSQETARLEKATADRDRIIPLYKENAVSRKDYDDAMSAHAAAVASRQTAQATVKQAELNLAYTKVTAPISGTTSKLVQSEGSLISASGDSGKLTTISQLDPMYVNFSYSEQDKQELEAAVRAGHVSFDPKHIVAKLKLADGHEYGQTGLLNFSDNRVDPKTGTIRARVIFKNPKSELLPGQFVRLSLELGTRKEALLIPERAVLQSQADRVVMTLGPENKVVPKPVKLGALVDGKVIVESGLKVGDKVIVDGLMKARPGSVVNPSAPPSASVASPSASSAASAEKG